MSLEYEEAINAIHEAFPEEDIDTIKKLYSENNDIEEVVIKINKNRKKGKNTRTVVTICQDINSDIVCCIEEMLHSIPSSQIEITSTAPQWTISISHNNVPCKPMIYVEPTPIDEQFISSIEAQSIILSSHYDDIKLKAISSLFSVTILQLTENNIKAAFQHALIESGIIGEGFPRPKQGILWNDILSSIPLISQNYSNLIAQNVSNPYSIIHFPPKEIITPKGNKIPQKILDSLQIIFTSTDPNQKIDKAQKKR